MKTPSPKKIILSDIAKRDSVKQSVLASTSTSAATPPTSWFAQDCLVFGGTKRRNDPIVNFLSNFYPSPITVNSRRLPHVESAFQAAKFFTKPELQDKFADLGMSPADARKLGRVKRMTKEELDSWVAGRDEASMKEALRAKFVKGEELGEKLVATSGVALVEDNGRDKKWGTVKGEGRNLLGVLLMERRTELRNEESS